jgi:tetratricopeptide (TPR) repeat protein
VAAKLFELATALAGDREDQRVPLVPGLGRSLRAIGKLSRAEEILNEVADRTGDAPTRFAFLEAASLRDYTVATTGSFLELKEAAEVDPASAPEVRARRKIVEAEVSWTIGKYGDMAGPLADAVEAADELGGAEGRTLGNSALGWMARSLLLGPTPAEEARSRCDEILEEARASDSRALEAAALAVSAGLHAMLGDFDEARRRYKESRRIGEVRGLESWLGALPLYSGPAELLAEQPDDARRQLRRGRDLLEAMGDRSRRATTAAFLAQALCEQQRDDEALRFVREAKGLAGADDVYTQVVWRGALAKVLARRGERDRARERAEEAVELAEGTDGLNLQGDAYLDLAEVQSAEDPSTARESAERARDRYEEKGNVAAVRRANSFIARLPS